MLFSKRPPTTNSKGSKAGAAPPPLDVMRQAQISRDEAAETAIENAAAKVSSAAPVNNPALAALGHLVTLLASAPEEGQHTLKDLQWLAMPAITLGQYALAHATADDGRQVPVGAVLWAHVSPDVDMRLSDPTVDIVKLAPNEWRSGDILWVTLLVASAELANGFINDISRSAFKSAPAKIRFKTADGRIKIGTLAAQ